MEIIIAPDISDRYMRKLWSMPFKAKKKQEDKKADAKLKAFPAGRKARKKKASVIKMRDAAVSPFKKDVIAKREDRYKGQPKGRCIAAENINAEERILTGAISKILKSKSAM